MIVEVQVERTTSGWMVVCSTHGAVGFRVAAKRAAQVASRHYDNEHSEDPSVSLRLGEIP